MLIYLCLKSVNRLLVWIIYRKEIMRLGLVTRRPPNRFILFFSVIEILFKIFSHNTNEEDCVFIKKSMRVIKFLAKYHNWKEMNNLFWKVFQIIFKPFIYKHDLIAWELWSVASLHIQNVQSEIPMTTHTFTIEPWFFFLSRVIWFISYSTQPELRDYKVLRLHFITWFCGYILSKRWRNTIFIRPIFNKKVSCL